MNPVSYTESRLGPFDLWPAYILRFLFLDTPNPATMRRVAAFFYGNRIECGIAAHFVCICNGQANVSVRQYMYACYIRWQNSPKLYHIVEYFDMRLRQHLYVNGCKSLRGVEPVVLVPSRLYFGPGVLAPRWPFESYWTRYAPKLFHPRHIPISSFMIIKAIPCCLRSFSICCYPIILFRKCASSMLHNAIWAPSTSGRPTY
jgi:hypothetical protein